MAYSYLDLATDVLKAAKQPLIYQEIWEAAKTSGLSAKIKTSGKHPGRRLGLNCMWMFGTTQIQSSSKSAKDLPGFSQGTTIRNISKYRFSD